METSGLDLSLLTIDDIINAMRMNGIRRIDIGKNNPDPRGPYKAIITEWFGAVTKIDLT